MRHAQILVIMKSTHSLLEGHSCRTQTTGRQPSWVTDYCCTLLPYSAENQVARSFNHSSDLGGRYWDRTSDLFGVNADCRAFAYLRVSLCTAELRLRVTVYQSVRTRGVAFADDSLTMITVAPSPLRT